MIQISTPEEWSALKERCKNEGKDLFLAKLSPACPVSHTAEDVLVRWLPNHPQTTFIAARVDVIRARNLARAIAQEVEVKHESPQVILLDSEGKAKWDSDHFNINEDNLNQQFPR
jgi:bacillithiol system protein YtxJ